MGALNGGGLLTKCGKRGETNGVAKDSKLIRGAAPITTGARTGIGKTAGCVGATTFTVVRVGIGSGHTVEGWLSELR